MKFDLNSWEEIFITLARNKSRSLLTAFGVFWGIFMLIVLIGLGQGLRTFMSKNFEGSNQNTSFIMTRRTSEAYKGFQKGRNWKLEYKDIERLKKIEGIDIVCPAYITWGGTTTYNEFKSTGSLLGTEPTFNIIQKQNLSYGRFINNIDLAESRKVCVLGSQVYVDLFPRGEDPTGSFISIQGVYYQVIGVIKAGDSSMNFGGDPEQQIILPLTTLQALYNKGDEIDFIALSGNKDKSMSDLQGEIESTLKTAHMIAPNDKQAIFFLNTEAMFNMVNSLMLGINLLIWLVGAGTLMAGIIGVSNIMMVTVKERTTEFGIRRAIGALPQDILGQIILESIVITILSGTAGLVIGVLSLSGVESIVNAMNASNVSFQVSFGLSMGIFISLILLGILAGMAPAYRALAIKPIDAIREE
ncbi:protein of unknown function DUF214 [Bacteroides coprosuis DSM 18011]|uniref:ABC3 transporter permease protein domain-containing protein n=1 Tax=Bacteroides coprosuis DSM 18011 TaxID=679937 RepID=F3ZUH2_9BACE|nr:MULTISPECIES: ABC transporter permease [Bacteroides]EGJ72420.1 protein of unknown function DUF214 [Bacteroides coprosuis DSM 18011]HJD92585.1 ABC transporter permease [Bacteroides coprosuis]